MSRTDTFALVQKLISRSLQYRELGRLPEAELLDEAIRALNSLEQGPDVSSNVHSAGHWTEEVVALAKSAAITPGNVIPLRRPQLSGDVPEWPQCQECGDDIMIHNAGVCGSCLDAHRASATQVDGGASGDMPPK